MYLKINNKKIIIKEYIKTKDKFKSLKFVLEPIDYGIKLTNKKLINTYFFCQKVDVCVTDHDDKILYLYENMKSEKKKLKLRAKDIYYFPPNTCKYLDIGEKLHITKK